MKFTRLAKYIQLLVSPSSYKYTLSVGHFSTCNIEMKHKNVPVIQSLQYTSRYTYATVTTAKKDVPQQSQKRVPRKKGVVTIDVPDKEKFLAVAYSSADQYNIPLLKDALYKQGLYKRLSMPADAEKVLHVTANYQVEKEPRHVYFFSEGCVVFWNISETEQRSILSFLKPFQVNPCEEDLVVEENEDLEYFYAENDSRLSNGRIVLTANTDTQLETYAFSNGLAHSVKLAQWETALELFIERIQLLTENMRDGKKLNISRKQVFRKRGELFSLRHAINLSSDLLDTPDFYWDREHLEKLYQQTYNHLNISRRTKVMNERLNYCSELIDLLGNQINDQHHIRLEWMIIILILVEVMFEFAHFIERLYGSKEQAEI